MESTTAIIIGLELRFTRLLATISGSQPEVLGQHLLEPLMAKTPPKTTVSSEGLRYHSKVPGSPFVATGHFGAATMSCFLCGKHRPRAQLKSRKLMGKTHFVCAPSCKELEEQNAVR